MPDSAILVGDNFAEDFFRSVVVGLIGFTILEGFCGFTMTQGNSGTHIASDGNTP